MDPEKLEILQRKCRIENARGDPEKAGKFCENPSCRGKVMENCLHTTTLYSIETYEQLCIRNLE